MKQAANPLAFPGLICFWDFQERRGGCWQAQGPHSYRLREGGQPVEQAGEGVFGPSAVRLGPERWLVLPRSECPALDRHGAEARITLVAWVCRAPQDPPHCEAIAGMWNETLGLRQYCLFLNLSIWGSRNQVCGHVSAVGGPTPGHPYCMDASIGATPVPFDRWQCVAFSYDGREARSFLNGRLDLRQGRNPYPYPGGLFNPGSLGSDFTVGAVHRSNAMGNWYSGLLGGLAVYDRALGEGELAALGALPV